MRSGAAEAVGAGPVRRPEDEELVSRVQGGAARQARAPRRRGASERSTRGPRSRCPAYRRRPRPSARGLCGPTAQRPSPRRPEKCVCSASHRPPNATTDRDSDCARPRPVTSFEERRVKSVKAEGDVCVAKRSCLLAQFAAQKTARRPTPPERSKVVNICAMRGCVQLDVIESVEGLFESVFSSLAE